MTPYSKLKQQRQILAFGIHAIRQNIALIEVWSTAIFPVGLLREARDRLRENNFVEIQLPIPSPSEPHACGNCGNLCDVLDVSS